MVEDRPKIGTVGRRRRHSLRWYWRMPLKWLVFLAVLFVVLFPDPRQFARHISHLSNLDSMVDPDAPELAAWEAEVRTRMARTAPAGSQEGADSTRRSSPQMVQAVVQKLVLDKVQYGWDWDVWGSADYMPTVGEIFARAESRGGVLQEDCDGRAVMAASLMRRLGYNARIVTDLRHVWVTTPQGEWMGPGRIKTIVSDSSGNRINLRSAGANIPVSLSYGIAVFPLGRELVILAAAFVLSWNRRMSWRAAALAGLLAVQGLLFMRLGVLDPSGVSQRDSAWAPVVGAAHLAAGFAILWIASMGIRSKTTWSA